MPELPEVETVVRDLRPLLCGRRIVAARAGELALRFAWQPVWSPRIIGRRIATIRRRGKWIVIDLDDDSRLLAHLGMTGQFRVLPAGAARESHTHLTFELDNAAELRFRDGRRFGGMRYCTDESEIEQLMGERLGPEPWDLQPEEWFRALRRRRRALKAILLDQLMVAGVGNIYADECLFEAGLSPRRLGSTMARNQAERLRRAIIDVLDRAIAARGSTIRDFVGGSGLRGEYQQAHRVYGRTGEPCRACRTAIRRIVLAGRSTHFCPKCQSVRSKKIRVTVR